MNGSTRNHTAMIPLTAPIPIDTARAAMAPSRNRPSEPSIAIAATMAAIRTLAPSERSTPLTSTTTNCASDASREHHHLARQVRQVDHAPKVV